MTQRERVKVQDVSELRTGEFYGQLIESEFNSFKAQIEASNGSQLPEIVPFAFMTEQDVKQNFLQIQGEVGSFLHKPA